MKNIVIIFGGDTLEHEVSLKTGHAVAKELMEANCYNLFYIAILKTGEWKYADNIDTILLDSKEYTTIKINQECDTVFQIGDGMINNIKIDKAFLATHGNLGEDGNLQGFLKINNIPYTGNDVDGSVVCYNKNITKSVAEVNNINVVPYITLNKYDFKKEDSLTLMENIKKKELGDNLIVKINKGGCSIGVFQCTTQTLLDTIEKAFELDDFILIEKEINNMRELCISILLSKEGHLFISNIKEYLKNCNFFSFEEKYIHILTVPDNKKNMPICENVKKIIIEDSTLLYKKLNLKSYVRFDYFVDENNNVYFNEINNLPGLKKYGIFSKMWQPKFTLLEILNYIIDI